MFIGVHTHQSKVKELFSLAMDRIVAGNIAQGYRGITTSVTPATTARIVDHQTPALEITVIVPGLSVFKEVNLQNHQLLTMLHQQSMWPMRIAAEMQDALEAEVLTDVSGCLSMAWNAVSYTNRSNMIPQDINLLEIPVMYDEKLVNVQALTFTYVKKDDTSLISLYGEPPVGAFSVKIV